MVVCGRAPEVCWLTGSHLSTLNVTAVGKVADRKSHFPVCHPRRSPPNGGWVLAPGAMEFLVIGDTLD